MKPAGSDSNNHDCIEVFVSYSRETDAHREWVGKLADRLDSEPDLHVVLDEYDLYGGKDLPHFMERCARCDRVVVIVTSRFAEKADQREGGVGYETAIAAAELATAQNNDRFIPVLREGSRLPVFARGKRYVDLRSASDFERGVEELLRAIRRQADRPRPTKRVAADDCNAEVAVREPERRLEKYLAAGLTTIAVPSQEEITYPVRTRTSGPQIVLEGRFTHRESKGRRQGMHIHNVGDAIALEVHIEPLGHEPKWMMFEKVAVVRPDTNPVEVSITFVDAADVFEVGAYISMISTLRGEATITDDVAAHDGHPLRITYRDREGTEHVNHEYELHFHESTPFIAANAYYEVQRRWSSPAAERIPPGSDRIPAATAQPRIRLSRSQRAIEKPLDTKAMIKGLYIPLFDVRNTGEEEAFDVLVTLRPTDDLRVTSRRIDHLPAGGEKRVLHGDLRYEQNGIATEHLNLWFYITTANIGGPKIRLPLRASVSYRDRRNRHYTTMYDVDGEACTFIADEE